MTIPPGLFCGAVRLRRVIFLLLPWFATALAWAAAGDPRPFNLPAGSAEQTLKEFSAQSGVQLAFATDTVQGIRTNAVRGELPPAVALERMLDGTPLIVVRDEKPGAFAIRRGPNVQRAAQTTASDRPMPKPISASRTDAGAGDETVQLSPFEVQAEEDNGYKATSTLAGTRLRSDLKDLAASISVVTKDFMDDVNATDFTSLLVYTLGTEVGGFGGNFSDLSNPEANGVFDDALGQPNPGTRVRGLTGADRTQNYFQSDVPMDTYNSERVEINRGANANLFGLGSPSGIVNTGLISADVRRRKTSVSAAYGSYGSYRATFDHSEPIVKDKLALRLATVFDNKRYRIEDALQKKKGITLAATYQPFKNTKVRVTSEWGRNDSNKPEQRPAYDSFSWWWAAGQPVYNPVTGIARLLGTPQAPFTRTTTVTAAGARNGTYLTTAIDGWSANMPGIFYLNPNSSRIGGIDIGGGATVDGIKGFATNAVLNPAGTALANGGMVGLGGLDAVERNIYQAGNPLASLYNKRQQNPDPRFYDFYHQMLAGPTKYEWSHWNTNNASLEHTFLDGDAGVEIAYHQQRMDSGFVSPVDYRLNLDVNEVLPNGAPNPNFLRPVIGYPGFKRVFSDDRDAYRGTAYYSRDLRQVGPRWLGKFLGRHRIQGTYTGAESLRQKLGGYMWHNSDDWGISESMPVPGAAGSTGRLVSVVHYLGDSVAGSTGPEGYRAQGLTVGQDPSGTPSITLLYNKRPTSTALAGRTPWAPATFNLVSNGREDVANTVRSQQGQSDRKEQQAKSLSFTLQDRWLDGTIITTFGWRRDQVWNYDAGLPPLTGTGTADMSWDVWYPKLARELSAKKTNWGIVGHLPRFIQRRLPWDTEGSVFYNSASNFRVAEQRYTITGEALPAETGETKEYGLRFSTFGGRLDFRIARYETIADKATVNGLNVPLNQLSLLVGYVVDNNFAGNNANNPTGIADFEKWLNGPQGEIFRGAFGVNLAPNTAFPKETYGSYSDATGDRGQINGVSAVQSKGVEMELTFNPLRNWRMAANFSTTEAVRTKIAPELYDYFFNPTTGLLALVQNPDGSPTAVGRLIGANAAGNTVQNFINSSVLNNGIITTFAQDGTKSDELRGWDFHALTNYTFTEEQFGGHLRGFGVGGAVRWGDKPVIGYGGTILNNAGASLAVSDVNQPFYGSNDPTFDLWCSYSRKLSHGISWKVQLNVKNVGVGNELLPLSALPDGRVITWRIREPQLLTLTNTFTF